MKQNDSGMSIALQCPKRFRLRWAQQRRSAIECEESATTLCRLNANVIDQLHEQMGGSFLTAGNDISFSGG